jgi:uracil-DNA glycosylase
MFPEAIEQFAQGVAASVATRGECRECPLRAAPHVVLDSNAPAPGPVDVAFVGLNPGRREVEQGRPFVGPAGQILRSKLTGLAGQADARLPENARWLITNVILGHTPNETAIPKPGEVLTRCRGLVESILTAFPARLTVAVGLKPVRWFGIEDAMEAASGRLFKTARGPVMPLVHPSAVKRFPWKWGPVFDAGWAAICAELDR